jgi:hypothetical protein
MTCSVSADVVLVTGRCGGCSRRGRCMVGRRCCAIVLTTTGFVVGALLAALIATVELGAGCAPRIVREEGGEAALRLPLRPQRLRRVFRC